MAKSNPAADAVKEQQKRTQAITEDAERRMSSARPTPTQEENDLAKVGAMNIDDKDADGTEEDEAERKRAASADDGSSASYSTRSASASGDKKKS